MRVIHSNTVDRITWNYGKNFLQLNLRANKSITESKQKTNSILSITHRLSLLHFDYGFATVPIVFIFSYLRVFVFCWLWVFPLLPLLLPTNRLPNPPHHHPPNRKALKECCPCFWGTLANLLTNARLIVLLS